MTEVFVAKAVLQQLRADAAEKRKKLKKSKLTKYAGQILDLRSNGATISEIQRWLVSRQMSAEHTTITRWLSKNG